MKHQFLTTPKYSSAKKLFLFFIIILTSILTTLLISGCTSAGDGTAVDPQAIYTSAAITAQAKLTIEAGSTAVAELTQLAQTPTSTTTSTPPPTAVFISPTPTAAMPTPIPTAANPADPCDLAEFVGDITVPPESGLPITANFIKIWRAKNIGDCTWTPQYALAFVGGNSMTFNNAALLPGTVQPGQIIDLSVYQTVPPNIGTSQGNWMLRNTSNALFGYGPNASNPFIVRVNSFPYPVLGDFAYDFGKNYCAARWSSASGLLGCPGNNLDSSGSAILLENPNLETGLESRPALWTRPDSGFNGSISGIYPSYSIQDGDRFMAEIGCLGSSPGCDVNFQLDYRTVDGLSGRLGTWREFLNGQTTMVDINLSGLTGQTAQFTLTVINNGVARDANAFWFLPRIERSRPNSALYWRQEGRTPASCDVLNVFWASEFTFWAEASSCAEGQRILGNRNLTETENNQMLTWVNRLRTFDAEIYQSGPERALTSDFVLRGRGPVDQSEDDIQAINSFARQVFLSIIQ